MLPVLFILVTVSAGSVLAWIDVRDPSDRAIVVAWFLAAGFVFGAMYSLALLFGVELT